IVLSRSTDTTEIVSLLSTLRVDVVKEYLQRKDVHPTSYFGPGKIEEITEEVKEIDPDMIVVNDRLKPSQHHFIEMRFQKECVDRTGVILRIFAEHAYTPEAIAQVQLARLRYEQPFLREWIHKAKSGERPGFLAGGAYATDVYYEHAKTHMRRIENRLDELSRMREVKRGRRHEEGFTLVSLAGYTNAGKSALMNALCGSEVEVSPQLFSSLSTTTRRVRGVKGKVLAIDTVGFIKDLPPDLVDAFKSTLEEVFFADLILLAFDASEDDISIKDKLGTSLDILLPRIGEGEMLVVGTKVDTIPRTRAEDVERMVRSMVTPSDVVMSSSVSGEGLEEIRERITETQGHTHGLDVHLPLTDASYSLLSRLHNVAEVSHRVEGGQLRAELWCSPEEADKVRNWLLAAGATLLADRPREGRRCPRPPSEAQGPP
ncbi:MAG: GTPase HflX, partial [Thermoplasmata archaeon]